jgi:DNA repair protein SbcD/Mre11
MARSFFLHAADLHLGAPLKSLGSRIDSAKADYIRAEVKRAFDDLVDVAIERKVDFVVLAGDVYDNAENDRVAQLRVNAGFRRLKAADIHVYMVHGNHDPLGATQRSNIRELPDNVTIFPHDSVLTYKIQVSNGVTVTVAGISYLSADERRPLASMFEGLSGSPLVGVLHTNVGGSREHGDYAPCTAAELLASPVNYWALGHIHLRSVNGSVNNWWVYPGNLQGRFLKPSECGPKGVMIVPIDEAGTVLEPEFVVCDRARFEQLVVPCEGFTTVEDAIGAAASQVAAKVEANGSRPTVFEVELTGASMVHGVLTADEFCESLSEACKEFINYGQVVKVTDRTRKIVNADEVRRSKTVTAEAMQVLDARRADAMVPLISVKDVPRDVKIFVESGEDRDEILTRAEQVLIDRLWGAQ